jgi:hypothetical protein
MNTASPPPSTPRTVESPAPATDLDRLIAEAEQAVIRRDRRVQALTEQVKAGTVRRASRGLALALGALAISALLPHRKRIANGHPKPFLAELPWARLVPFAWPFFPAALRSRISPAAGAALFGVLLPLLANLFGRKRTGRPRRP